jgi:hypothetical protein
MKKILFTILFSTIFPLAYTQISADYYLPQEISYSSEIPAPRQFFGHEVGEWHLSHDKLLSYMLALAEASDRAVWEEYGRSHENRPLGHLIISSPGNIRNLEQIRLKHLELSEPSVSGRPDIRNMPLVIRMGYGIHGNESSAQNSSALVAYYLTSGSGQKIDELLEKTIILIDPSLNPDGMQRHSSWVNFARSLNDNPDPGSWEFSEPWPGGRTNHYWFDLNRDYIMLQHPESQGRVEAFYRWRPNINTDHHEQGSSATFFYMPGIQSRNNPLTPADNQQLTAEIGKYHEKYLNSIGSLYFTEEGYDDFYLGKGSSFPDIHGSIGILFEQAGVRGHLRETPGFLLSFPFAIRNQFTVSLSTLEAGLNMREKLLEHQMKFYSDVPGLAAKHPVSAYVFTESDDKGRLSEFIRILLSHRIKVYTLKKDITKNGITYRAQNSYVVPMNQPEHRFIRSLFEPIKEFTDSSFYDISTWILPMSFNIPYSAVTTSRESEGLAGEALTSAPEVEGIVDGAENPFAYLFEWKEYLAPRALYELQKAGVVAKVAKKEFAYANSELNRKFTYGTIMVPVSGQKLSSDELKELMISISKDCGIRITGVSTGYTESGMDLGSGSFAVVEKPSVAMIVGDGASSADAGEIWHMLDTRFRMPVTLINASRFASVNLDRYNVLIITGSPAISQTGTDNIRRWTSQGGVIIGYKGGNTWLSRNKIIEIEYVPAARSKILEGVYAERSANSQTGTIPGSIFETRLDLTHPLCYGYTKDKLPVFKSGTQVAKNNPGIYNNPVKYTDAPLLSGYCTEDNLRRLAGAPFASVNGSRVISFYDNTNFRAIWYGTSKIFMNAIFFGQVIN